MSIQSLLTHKSGLPPSDYYTILGQAGVSVFFMITGYLFWSKLIRSEGRQSWIELYIGRVFRIVPLYLVLAVSACLITAIETNWTLRVLPSQLVYSLLEFSCGGFFGVISLNQFAGLGSVIGPVWTLHYEWLFYLSLFFIGQVCRNRWAGLMFPLALTGLILVHFILKQAQVRGGPSICVMQFLAGMSVASLRSMVPAFSLSDAYSSGLLLTGLAATFVIFDRADTFTATLWLTLLFGLIVLGSPLFGLLRSMPARRLGDVSYGIYLLQGPVGWIMSPLATYSAINPLAHWLFVLLTSVVLVGVASVAHIWVERTGVAAGKRTLRKWRSFQRDPHKTG